MFFFRLLVRLLWLSHQLGASLITLVLSAAGLILLLASPSCYGKWTIFPDVGVAPGNAAPRYRDQAITFS